MICSCFTYCRYLSELTRTRQANFRTYQTLGVLPHNDQVDTWFVSRVRGDLFAMSYGAEQKGACLH